MEKTKTDLLLFITPHIIKQYAKNRTLLQNRLSDRKEFIESHFLGQDPHEQSISKLKKSLPDLSNIEEMKPQPSLEQDISPNFQNNPRSQQNSKEIYESPWSDEDLTEEELAEELEEEEEETEEESIPVNEENGGEVTIPEQGVQL